MQKLLIGLVFLFLPAVAAAQTATVLANAPIYVTPVVTQSPLRVAAAGTTLQVLDDQGEWAKVAYNDPQWGRRIGWMQRSTIRIKDEALQPMDLSLPSARQSEQVSVAQVPQAPGYAPPRPQQPAFLKNHIIGRSGLTFGTETAPLVGLEVSGDVLPVLQVYGSFDWHQNVNPKSLQDDLDSTGFDIKSTLPTFAGMGGVKVMLPNAPVRPYALGGFGVGHGKATLEVDGRRVDLDEFVDAGIIDDDEIRWTKPVFEVGGGIAVPIGRVYIDVGYRFRKALNASEINMSGIYAGMGVSY